MFALPDLQQLQKYGDEVKKLVGDPSLILLSLADPGWPQGSWQDEQGRHWRYCSYRELVHHLRAEGLGMEMDEYATETFTRWLALIERLLDVVELVGVPSIHEPIALPVSVLASLRRRRLDVPIQKLRAHHIASSLRSALSATELKAVAVKAGVAHGVALVEAFVNVGDGVELGWQMQGDQWRLALRVQPGHDAYGRGDDRHQRRALLARDQAWMVFDHELVAGLSVGPRPSPEGERFGKFEPDFVYRYVNLRELTVEQAVDLGCSYIRAAQETRPRDTIHRRE